MSIRLATTLARRAMARGSASRIAATRFNATAAAPLLNNVNLPAVGALVGAIQADPQKAETIWKSTVEWEGAFKAVAHTGVGGKQKVLADEPPTLGGHGTAPNPVEIVLSSLGACLSVGYAAAASVNGVEIKKLKIDLSGDINIIPFLGLGKAHGSDNAGYRGIKVDVHLEADADDATLQKIHEHVQATSPVGHTLARPVPIEYKLHTK
ncbi:OsmC/Ohr family [Hyaloraphidium curvatum]|nr:OsmC/Ohr family [Hyaloraphidium curvatum]